MVMNKTSKARKQRGSRTHGWGKHHRGAGNRGGRGNAGGGKKAMVKKPSNPHKFGKYGFVPQNSGAAAVIINLGQLDQTVHTLIAEGKATESSGTFTVDLGKLGYDKLLATGKVTKKFKITIPTASVRAVEKVQAAGGEVITSNATPAPAQKESVEEEPAAEIEQE
jgi:large subunit ribosomal protein L15